MSYQITAADLEDDQPTKTNGGQYQITAEDLEEKPTVMGDIGSAISQAPGQLFDIAKGLPNEMGGAVHQIGHIQGRVPLNIMAGLASTGKAAYNLPLNINAWLHKHGLMPDAIARFAQSMKIGDTGLQQKVLGDKQPGDDLIQALAGFSPLARMGRGATGAKAVTTRAGVGAGLATGQDENPIVGALMNLFPEAAQTAKQKIPTRKSKVLSRNVSQAEKWLQENQEQASQLKQKAKVATGATEPAAILAKIKEIKTKTKDLEPVSKTPKQEIEKLLPPPTGKGLVDAAKTKTESIKSNLSKYLDKGASHDVELSQAVNKATKLRKKELGAGYKKMTADLKDRNVIIKDEAKAATKLNELRDIIKSGDYQSPEALKLLNEVDELSKAKKIPADEFLNHYRTADALSKKAMNDARSRGGLTQDERINLERSSHELAAQSKDMAKVLENNVGGDILKTLKDLNTGWSSDIASLYKHKTASSMEKTGRLESSAIDSLRGFEKGSPRLNKIIKSDPKMLRNLIGHKYADQPHKLADANKHNMSYIKDLPKLHGMVKELKAALKNEEVAASKAGKLKVESERIGEAFKEVKSKEIKRQEAVKKIKEYEKELKLLNKYENALNIQIKSGKLSKAKLEEAKAKLAKHKEKRANIKSLAKLAIGVTGFNAAAKKILNYF